MTDNERRMLTKRDILARIPFSASTLERMIKRGDFPRYAVLGSVRYWWEDEVTTWVERHMRESIL